MRYPATTRLAALLICGLGTQGGCTIVYPGARPSPPPPAPLPELRSGVIVSAPSERQAPRRSVDPLANLPPGNPITLAARNVDVRVLLLSLAEQAGISLVLDPTINSRVTVNFTDVPALDALRAVLAAAQLSVASGPPEPLHGPVVFYTVPVDVELASAELIQSRFRVSPEVARWIVENQLP